MTAPIGLAKYMDGGGHGFKQAVGLDVDLVNNPFAVPIFDLAECHGKRVTFRLLFAVRADWP